MLIEACIGLGGILLYLYYKLSKNKKHWSDRGVPNTGFVFFYGDDKDMLQGKRSMHDIEKEDYFKFPGERFYGGWTMLGQPYLMIRNDFELLRSIWIKDFDHFNKTRGADFDDNVWPSSRAERLAMQNMSLLHGEVWKNLRYSSIDIFFKIKKKYSNPTRNLTMVTFSEIIYFQVYIYSRVYFREIEENASTTQ